MKAKRNCEHTCQAGVLLHVLRRVVGEMEGIADILYGINLAYPQMDLSGLRQRIYTKTEELRDDIRESREVHQDYLDADLADLLCASLKEFDDENQKESAPPGGHPERRRAA